MTRGLDWTRAQRGNSSALNAKIFRIPLDIVVVIQPRKSRLSKRLSASNGTIPTLPDILSRLEAMSSVRG
jgi:hypothetical protein